MTPLSVFLWGMLGSISIEIVNAYNAINLNGGDLPPKYGKLPFVIVRILLSFMAGGLAVAYNIQQPLLAINIGAATPLILQSLSRNIKIK